MSPAGARAGCCRGAASGRVGDGGLRADAWRLDDLVDDADLDRLVDAAGDPLVLGGQLGLDLRRGSSGETSASLRRCRIRIAATAPITATSAPGQANTLVAPSERAFIAM